MGEQRRGKVTIVMQSFDQLFGQRHCALWRGPPTQRERERVIYTHANIQTNAKEQTVAKRADTFRSR